MTQKFAHILLCSLLASSSIYASSALAQATNSADYPSDSRIKILKYDPSDIYTIYTLYGYQTNIEFARGEEVQTISVGDRSLWQIIPSANRMFIRPMDDNVSTNMTVITNLHTYQFDIKSGSGSIDNNPRMVYVARFTYPEKNVQTAFIPAAQVPPITPTGYTPAVDSPPVKPLLTPPPAAPLTSITPAPENKTAAPKTTPFSSATPLLSPMPAAAPPPPADAKPYTQPSTTPATTAELPQNSTPEAKLNNRYTFTGPDALAPVQVYDDGKTTFMRFADMSGTLPQVKAISNDGTVTPVPAEIRNGYVAVNAILPRMLLAYSNDASQNVYLYNEALSNNGGVHGK
jgi:type IV secretory pathway VirB9-like protein